jgi:glycosyltransferase involved in cell wall biosynthesis
MLAKVVGKKLARIPVVITSEASVESAKPPVRVALDRLTARWPDQHYANAAAVRLTLIQREGTPSASVTTVPTGVDLKAFRPEFRTNSAQGPASYPSTFDKELSLFQHPPAHVEPVVVSVGRLDKYKGQEFLLEACARERTRPYRLILVGEGPMRPLLEAQAAGLGITDRVFFAGAQEDVRPFLARATCVALASTEEGMPGSILEAMAMARPVVASRVGGVPDAVTDGVTGYLIPPGDVGALAQAIASVLADPEKAEAMGRAARERAERDFDVELMVRKTEVMYETLVGPRRGEAPVGHAA